MIVRNVADTVLQFAESLNQNALHSSNLPRFEALTAEQPDFNDTALPTASQSQQSQPLSTVPQRTQPLAVEPQQAQQTTAASQQAQPMAIEFQQTQPLTVGSQQVQRQADGNNTQTAGVIQVPTMQMHETMPAEQAQPAVSHSSSYRQHSYDPGPGHFHDD